MKLKALMLGKKIEDLRTELGKLTEKDADFTKREADLTEAFNDLTEESTEDEKQAVTAEVDKYDAELSEHEEKKKNLQREIDEAEKELAEVENAQNEEKPLPEKSEGNEGEERKANIIIKKEDKRMFRSRAIKAMPYEERQEFMKSDDLHNFAEHIRSVAKMKERAVTGTDALIPVYILPLVYDEIYQASQLASVVNRQVVHGTARQNVQGVDQEGIWEGMLEAINERELAFTTVEVDGYKVAGYIPVDNAVLEDTDINLADTVLAALGRGCGYALDKAIVYGTGSTGKMPTGFAGTATKANVAGKTDLALYKAFVEATGSLKHENGTTFWCMNHKTKMKMLAAGMNYNANGAIVAQGGTMPVEGGKLIELDFVPDDEIVGGYGQDYLLAERAGLELATSEHAMFIQDKTVFRAKARYDGKPVFADGFMAIGLGSTDPTAAIDANHPFATVS